MRSSADQYFADQGFSQYVNQVQVRMENLYEDAQQYTGSHPDQLVTALEELRIAVEELHVAEEELITQNERLSTAQQVAEFERQRYRDLFEFAPDGYIVTSPKGIVQEANRAAAALLCVDPRFLVGKPLAAYVARDFQKAFRNLLNQIGNSHRVQGWELLLQGQRAEPVMVSVTLQNVCPSDQQEAALRWQLRDISDLKQAEATLNQLQTQNLELLEVDRLRTQFLATVSHELKTPMNAILGFSQMLMKQFNCQQDPKTITMVERIFHNGRHLLGLIEEMLNFARLQANHVELKPQTFDLVELIQTTLEELRPLADQKALTLSTDLPEESCIVRNDPSRLRQILTNLLSNAIKFTDLGQVTVSLQSLPEGRLRLQVKDTGCGISSEDQPQIFQEFWQVRHANTQAEGTGLGLAIVYALVQAMEGSVQVQSEVGKGSTFWVELPRQVGTTTRAGEATPDG